MERQINIIKRWIIATFCLTLVIAIALVAMNVGFVEGTTEQNAHFTPECSTITLMVPASHWDNETLLVLPARTLLVDNSTWNYTELLTATSNIGSYDRKCTIADYVKYSKEVDIDDYGSFEDVNFAKVNRSDRLRF